VAAAALCAPAFGGSPKSLIAAAWSQHTDSQGFLWDVQQGGYINHGTNYCFSNCMVLQVDGDGFSGQSNMMTADGSEYVLQQNMNGIDVTRRVKIDAASAGCRWIDSFTNTGGAAAAVTVSYQTAFNNHAQAVVSDTGRVNAMTLAKDEGGLIFVAPPNQNRPSALLTFASPRSKIKPALQVQNNSQVQANYALSIEPGKTVSLCTVVGQRTIVAPPASAKDAAALFKGFYSRNMTRDVPRAINQTVVNWRGGGFDPGERPVLWTLPIDLDLEPGPGDILAIGDDTRLTGTATCETLSIATRYGDKQIDFADVAALAGPRFRGRDTQVYLRDGQLLTGPITASGLRFALTSGPRMDLDFAMVDRLVTREPAVADVAEPVYAALIETFDGDRLALNADTELTLTVVTPWGARTLSLGDIRWIRNVTDERAGYEAALSDGSRFLCFLDGTTFKVNTLAFGQQELHTSQIKVLSTEVALPAGTGDDQRVDQPHVILAGGQVLVGRVDLEVIPLLTLGGVIPVPPGQVQVMRNVTDEAPPVPGDSGVVWSAELWGGGTVVGRYQDAALPVRFGGGVWHLPARDISEVNVPTPVVPEAMHVRALEMIRELGDPDWNRREAAQRELTALGPMAAGALREAVGQSQDPEVRRRATLILEQVD
jgi:hypothetical protein